MADNKVFSAKKIAKGFVTANLKLWGGDKVPYLANTVSFLFDVKGSIDKFKIEPSDKQKIKQSYAAIERESKNVSAERTKLNALSVGFEELLTKVTAIKATISLTSQSGEPFTGSTQYTVTENLLKRLDIDKSSITETFFRISNNAQVPNDIKKSYEDGLKTLKKIETDVMIQLNKLNTHSNQLKSAKRNLKNIVEQIEKKKKKK